MLPQVNSRLVRASDTSVLPIADRWTGSIEAYENEDTVIVRRGIALVHEGDRIEIVVEGSTQTRRVESIFQPQLDGVLNTTRLTTLPWYESTASLQEQDGTVLRASVPVTIESVDLTTVQEHGLAYRHTAQVPLFYAADLDPAGNRKLVVSGETYRVLEAIPTDAHIDLTLRRMA